MTPPRDPTADELAAGFVLGELSREDAATFERRLAGDPDLAEEVRRLRATLDLLPFATVTEPPAHLRARVLAGRGGPHARTGHDARTSPRGVEPVRGRGRRCPGTRLRLRRLPRAP